MSETFKPSVVVTESGEGFYGETIAAGRHIMRADEPVTAGGRDTGPSPYAYLLAGLGACTAMTVRMYAERHHWPLESVSVALAHEKIAASDEGGRMDHFRRVLTLTGPLDSEQRERLVEIASKCPVSQTLGRTSLVSASLDEPAAHGAAQKT